jgi:hypothetical protein
MSATFSVSEKRYRDEVQQLRMLSQKLPSVIKHMTPCRTARKQVHIGRHSDDGRVRSVVIRVCIPTAMPNCLRVYSSKSFLSPSVPSWTVVSGQWPALPTTSSRPAESLCGDSPRSVLAAPVFANQPARAQLGWNDSWAVQACSAIASCLHLAHELGGMWHA